MSGLPNSLHGSILFYNMEECKMEKLKLDPRNVRKHGKRNQQVIAESLRELGAGRSILIDSSNTAVAGNGVLEQAEKLGIPIRVVESDGSELIAVKRVDLSPDDPKRKALAIADNRASDLSLFDEDAMSKLLSECGDFKTKSGFNTADDSTEKPVDPDAPEVPFAEELLEKHNYVVLFFDNDVDWLQALTLFDLHTVKDSSARPGYERRGIGRVIRGADAINRILGGAR